MKEDQMGPFGYGNDDNRPRSGGCGPRLLIVLAFIGIAFFTYWNHTEENPVTGEKQHVSMTPSQEVRLGIQSAPEMAAQMGGEVPSTDPKAQEVQKIGQYLVQHTEAAHSPWRFQFHLLKDTKTVNAFALPGGQIFMTTGLFNKLTTEAQLAGVLAHEMGHVIERHSAQQLAKNQLGQMLIIATGIGASDPNNPNRAQQVAMIASVVNQMAQLRYSRHDELEADQWGLRLMAKAGFTPKAMVEVMEILKQSDAHTGHTPEMLLTHPYPEKRIEKIKEYLQEHPAADNLTEGKKLQEVVGSYSNSSSFY